MDDGIRRMIDDLNWASLRPPDPPRLCELCHGRGTTPLPRGMSYGFYGFMCAGGNRGMVCPACDGTGKERECG